MWARRWMMRMVTIGRVAAKGRVDQVRVGAGASRTIRAAEAVIAHLVRIGAERIFLSRIKMYEYQKISIS